MQVRPQLIQEPQLDFYKKGVPTPNTAESYNPAFYYQDTNHVGEINFQQVQKINSDFFIGTVQLEDPCKSEISPNQPSIQNTEIRFSVKMILIKKLSLASQEINRQIGSYFEEQSSIKLIFDKQYQKIQVDKDQPYILKAILVTEQGFERQLCCFQLALDQSRTGIRQICLIGQSQSFRLGLETEMSAEHWNAKFYYLQTTIQSIQQILDEKQRLVNKSEELNRITDIVSLKGIFFDLAKQNMGSRILQKLLNKSHPQKIEMVYQELRPHFSQMIKDRYGNYVYQKILELSPNKRRNEMFSCISSEFIQLAQTKTGTHTLQKLIECLNYQGLELVLQKIKTYEVKLSKNEFATHFMQKIITLYPHYNLVGVLLQNLQILACDKYAIVVLKSLLSVCSQNQVLKFHFLQKINLLIQKLLYDQYGHYIIEELFLYYSWHEMYQINNFLVYYIQKVAESPYSSSVVKKSLQIYGDCIAVPMINKILEKGLQQLLQCNSGSFVLHRLLDLSRNKSKHLLLKKIRQLVPEIKNHEKRNKWKQFLNIK